jgi:hypothetical protein
MSPGENPRQDLIHVSRPKNDERSLVPKARPQHVHQDNILRVNIMTSNPSTLRSTDRVLVVAWRLRPCFSTLLERPLVVSQGTGHRGTTRKNKRKKERKIEMCRGKNQPSTSTHTKSGSLHVEIMAS